MSEFIKHCPSEHPTKDINFIRTILRVLPVVRSEERTPGKKVSLFFTSPWPEQSGFTVQSAIDCSRSILRGECASFEYIEFANGRDFEIKNRVLKNDLEK